MRLRVFPTVEAPRQARQEVASLASSFDERSLLDLQTVVNELVTLVVSHGASKPIEVSLDFDDEWLTGVVCDAGPAVRAIRRARQRRDSSLVLRIIDGLVETWGADERENQIWFRMGVEPV